MHNAEFLKRAVVAHVDHVQIVTCRVEHIALENTLEDSFQLSSPTLPNYGEVIESLEIGAYNLQNNAMVVQTSDISNATQNGVLSFLNSKMNTENETCSGMI